MILTSLRIILLFSGIAAAANSTCGSLITYRQYSALLEGVPDCLRRGCDLSCNASLSSICPADSPCSELWTTVLKHTGLDWCKSQSCQKDLACRTHGWPIINAAQLCQSVPEDWMYLSRDCCASNNEPSDIARWIKKLCTQEWRDEFIDYGGMARDDWIEWILPWNWTVRYDNTTGEVKKPPKCSCPLTYLLLFAVESGTILMALMIIPRIQLLFHYSNTWGNYPEDHILVSLNKPLRATRRLVAAIKITWSGIKTQLWKALKFIICCCKRSQGDDDDSGAIQALLMAFVWVGLNIGITFANTFYMKAAPGFENFPSERLAFLWFARPNLSWITCAVGLFNRADLLQRVKDEYNEENDVWVVDLFTRAAYSAAVNELLMELLGAYYLWQTVNVGRHRGLFILHRLWGFYRGHPARNMYNGALVWVIAMPVLVLFWVLAAWALGSSVQELAKAMVDSAPWRARQKAMFKEAIQQMKTLFKARPDGSPSTVTGPPRQRRPSRIYRPPNPLQKFLKKYVIRGQVRAWLSRNIPEGSFKNFLRRHLLRSSLGEAPRRSLSRTESIHSHHTTAGVGESSSLIPAQRGDENTNERPALEMTSIQRTAPRRAPESRPLMYSMERVPPSQDVISAASQMPWDQDDIESVGPVMVSEVSSIPAQQQATPAVTSDRFGSRPFQVPQRRRNRQMNEETAYKAVPSDEPFVNRFQVSELGGVPPSNISNDSRYETSSRSLSTQDTAYHPVYGPELPTGQPIIQPGKSFWEWVKSVTDEWDRGHDMERTIYKQRWRMDSIRKKWMFLALAIGLCSYISQWMFWAGFVYTSRERCVTFNRAIFQTLLLCHYVY